MVTNLTTAQHLARDLANRELSGLTNRERVMARRLSSKLLEVDPRDGYSFRSPYMTATILAESLARPVGGAVPEGAWLLSERDARELLAFCRAGMGEYA